MVHYFSSNGRKHFGASSAWERHHDIGLREIVMGTLPFVILTALAGILLCIFPGIATWLPGIVMK
jgi:TRAP-type mannitol/chloroaromatic compound transport system permease large subunit